MGKPYQWTPVSNTTTAPASTATPAPTNITTGFPKGDVLLKGLMLRIRTNVSAATALVTDGRLINLRSVEVKTDKHQSLIEAGTDGLMLRALSIAQQPNGRGIRASASAADADLKVYLPFMDPESVRPEDTAVDLLNAVMSAKLDTGPAADIESTGGTTLSNLDVDVSAEVLDGPVDVNKYGPNYMPHFSVLKVPISQTTKRFQIELPYGDRIIQKLILCQRNGSTLAELNNTVIGVAAADEISLKVNNYPVVDRMRWTQLQYLNDLKYPQYGAILASSGVAILDFTERRAQGHMFGEALSLLDTRQGKIILEADVTSVSNGQMWIGILSYKPIPTAAKRLAPEPQKA